MNQSVGFFNVTTKRFNQLSISELFETWILWDCNSHGVKGCNFNLNEMKEKLMKIYKTDRVFVYDQNQQVNYFPKTIVFHENNVGWSNHEVSLFLFLERYLPEMPQVKGMWILEPDAYFFGDLNLFLENTIKQYKPIKSSNYVHTLSNSGKAKGVDYMSLAIHPANPRHSYLSAKTFNLPNPHQKWEYVEYYSLRLLSSLKMLIENNVFTWGELFAGTVCKNTRWCNAIELSEYADPRALKGEFSYDLTAELFREVNCNKNHILRNRFAHRVSYEIQADPNLRKCD